MNRTLNYTMFFHYQELPKVQFVPSKTSRASKIGNFIVMDQQTIFQLYVVNKDHTKDRGISDPEGSRSFRGTWKKKIKKKNKKKMREAMCKI